MFFNLGVASSLFLVHNVQQLQIFRAKLQLETWMADPGHVEKVIRTHKLQMTFTALSLEWESEAHYLYA